LYIRCDLNDYKPNSLKLLLVVQLTQNLRNGIIAPILALFIRSQGLTVAQIGLLGTIEMLGWFIFEPLTGVVADRVGKKRLVIFAIVSSSFIFVFFPLAISIWHFALLMFARSSVMSTASVSIRAMTAELLPTSGRGKAYGRHMSVISMGGIIGPFIGGYLTYTIGYTIPFYVSAGVGIAGLAAVLLMRYDERPIIEPSSPSEVLKQSKLMTRPFLAILLVRSLYMINFVFRRDILPIFLHESQSFKASETQIGVYMSIVQFSAALSELFLGSLTDRVGSRKIIASSLGLSGLSYLSMVYLAGTLPLYLLGAFQGTFFAAADLGMMIHLIAIMPEGRTGMVMGIYSESENIGGMVASPTMGMIYDSMGPTFLVLSVSTILIFNAVLSILLIKKGS